MPHRVPTYRPRAASLPSARPRDSERDRESKRFYNSSAWVRLRRMHLARSPLCVKCQAAGRLVPATHVHHVVAFETSTGRDVRCVPTKTSTEELPGFVWEVQARKDNYWCSGRDLETALEKAGWTEEELRPVRQ
jgi:hypothetical protein